MKKLSAWVLAAAMTLSLAACGRPADNPGTPPPPAASSAPAASAPAASAPAADYTPPSRVTCFAPYSVGGGVDIFGRTITAMLNSTGISDVTFLYENVGGSSGRVGMKQIVEQHDGDESYLLPSSTTYLTTAFLEPELGGYSYKDVTMLAKLGTDYRLYVVPAASGITTMEQLIELGKQRELVSAISGVAGIGECGIGALSLAAGIPIRCVPMDGTSAVTAAILGNQVDCGVMAVGEAQTYVQSGQVNALAVAAPSRLEEMPDIPTTAECGLENVILPTSRGFIMPANVSQACQDYWIARLRELYESPEFEAYCKENQMTREWAEGDEFYAITEEECSRMVQVFAQYNG